MRCCFDATLPRSAPRNQARSPTWPDPSRAAGFVERERTSSIAYEVVPFRSLLRTQQVCDVTTAPSPRRTPPVKSSVSVLNKSLIQVSLIQVSRSGLYSLSQPNVAPRRYTHNMYLQVHGSRSRDTVQASFQTRAPMRSIRVPVLGSAHRVPFHRSKVAKAHIWREAQRERAWPPGWADLPTLDRQARQTRYHHPTILRQDVLRARTPDPPPRERTDRRTGTTRPSHARAGRHVSKNPVALFGNRIGPAPPGLSLVTDKTNNPYL